MRRTGFTLVEILIVVIILGILAAVTIPMMANGSTDARNATFRSNLRDLIQVASLYHQEYGDFPSQGAGDALPEEIFTAMGRENSFRKVTPLGGFWHIGKFTDVDRFGVGIWWPTDETGVLEKVKVIDATVDDGVESTGNFQNRDERYYWLVN